MTLSRPSTQSLGMILARSFQLAVIVLAVGLFIVSIPNDYKQRTTVCQTEPCPRNQLSLASVKALNELGMTVNSLILLDLALDILIALTYTASAVVILMRKPDELQSILVTVMLVTFGTATFTSGIRGITLSYPQLKWLVTAIGMIGNVAIMAFTFVFPNGRFTPRWTPVILLGWLLFHIPPQYFPQSRLDLSYHSPVLYNLLFSAIALSGVGAQIYRYLRVSNAVEREQTKWVVYGLTIGVGGYLVIAALSSLLADPLGANMPITIAVVIAGKLLILLLPISISIAVLRYRLWDINPIINRTLVYGVLSAGTMLFYILVVGFFSNYFQQSRINFVIAFVATGVIAVLFEPVRRRLQRAVNRLMYGERDDPTTMLTQLSQRFESVLAPDSVLQTIVETLAQTLRLPYAAISIHTLDDEARRVSRFGEAPSETISLPLTYQTEHVGELILAPRAPGESFSSADMNLLNIVAGQAGIAVHNLRLTNDLQRSREKLVTAQEEERRRLRRDLHDGVGPTLASLSQRLDAAADLIKNDPQASVELLKELKGQVKSTVAEIRRLVYALRPPVLDEFGLVSAIREHIAQYTGPNGLSVAFDVTEPMPPLPAAVEVAAYRIILEAFTNVVQHAQATRCQMRIRLENAYLCLEVSDDGKGLSAKLRPGVGLTSMRERAAELGGECAIENLSSGGTRVSARLPVPKE
ncbi:MAG TPA: GAF domain-containing sensor histidine kinase [Anaerolineales bacterium]|nr:GAF domain-containing sensor histidine kinase [Anaerolineales bacterium]